MQHQPFCQIVLSGKKKWFNKWYGEKFVSPFEKDAIKQNEKSTETRLSGKKNIPSLLHYLRKRNKSKRSITEYIFDNKRNNNDQEVAVYSRLTNFSTKFKVVDKAINQMISKTRRVDIDTSFRIFNGEHEYYSDRSDSFVTDLNQYGNGESDCDWLSKSKDSRQYRQTKSTVGTTKLKLSEPFISEIVPAFNELSIIDSDRSEWLTNQSDNNCHHKLFLNQTREPKSFKTDRSFIIKSDLNLNSRKRITNQYQTCNEHQFDDWVIVSIELKSITSCESFSDDDHISYLNETASSVNYFTTCEYCDIDKQPMVTLNHCPSIYSLNSTYCYESDTLGQKRTEYYGITCSQSRCFQRIFWIFGIFDINIKIGTPFNDLYANSYVSTASFINMNCYTKNIANLKSSEFHGSFLSSESILSSDTMPSDIAFRLQEPCSSKIQFNYFLGHSAFTSISAVDSTSKYHKTESIPEYFGLSDQGDIIINIDHISEEKGFGFMMRRKKEVYRKVPYGEEMCEKEFFNLGSIIKMFKSLSDKFCKCYRGE